MQRIVREEVLADVARIGGRLSELRLDTDLDISHGVARYLELLKLSALAQRPAEQSVSDALADVNARLLAAVTALEREILQSSARSTARCWRPTSRHAGRRRGAGAATGAGTGGYDEQAARVQAVSPRGEPSLVPFLPRKGGGWRCRPRTSRPTAAARCATSSRAYCASRPSRRSASASGSSCTRCSSAITPRAGRR